MPVRQICNTSGRGLRRFISKEDSIRDSQTILLIPSRFMILSVSCSATDFSPPHSEELEGNNTSR